MKCEFCGRDEALPFVCNYCGGAYCPDHRLPEAHLCKGDLSARRTVVPPPQTTYTWSTGPSLQGVPAPGKAFSGVEVRDILVAWLGLGFAFFISLNGGVFGLLSAFPAQDAGPDLSEKLAIALIAIGSGFVLHELSHKFTARRYGYWAEFRMWTFGLFLAIATSLIGFIFAAPGATYISGSNISRSENGKISLAGPLTNLGVAFAFFLVFLASPPGFVSALGWAGTYFNIFLAVFNLLPLGPLDGSKVFAWNKAGWAAVFVPLAIVLYTFVSLTRG
ncbi:MAG: hypothetical protein HY247_01975 [archaeon]|nr:MAG: hypothetical protein HY247_01975 [archaeon]